MGVCMVAMVTTVGVDGTVTTVDMVAVVIVVGGAEMTCVVLGVV